MTGAGYWRCINDHLIQKLCNCC